MVSLNWGGIPSGLRVAVSEVYIKYIIAYPVRLLKHWKNQPQNSLISVSSDKN